MATSASTVVAARAAKARREVRHRFTQANAFTPASAIAYEPPTRMHLRQMDRLLLRGVLRKAANGRFWLDQERLLAEEQRRRTQGVLLLKIMICAIFVVAIVVAVAIAKG